MMIDIIASALNLIVSSSLSESERRDHSGSCSKMEIVIIVDNVLLFYGHNESRVVL